MVMCHRMWCKQAVIAMKKGEAITPYELFISGPGGVGKSHIIRIIQSDTIKLLRLSGMIELQNWYQYTADIRHGHVTLSKLANCENLLHQRRLH